MQVTIKEIVDFYNEFPEFIGDIEVKTRFGFRDIEYADCTAEDSDVYTIKTKLGREISGSPDHRLFINGGWKHLKDVTLGDKILDENNLLDEVVSIRIEDETEDLYDLQVADVHEFYANGLVSHNSSFADSICFALFGRSLRRVNKNQLINSVNNKRLEVDLEFESDGGKNTYRIFRGIKPTKFEIYKNGVMVNQESHNRDYQKWLEVNVLKFSFRSFQQVVVLGASSFTPFMQLSASQRREVVEDLLDIRIFSKMLHVLKERSSALRNHMTVTETQIRMLKDKMKLQKSHLERLREILRNQKNESTAQITELKTKLTELKSRHSQLEKELKSSNKNRDRLDELREEKESIAEKISGLRRDIRSHEADIEFFEKHAQCPKCGSELTDSHRKKHITESKSKIKDLQVDFIGAELQYKELESEYVDADKKYLELQQKKYDLDRIEKDSIELLKKLKEMEKTNDSQESLKTDIQSEESLLKETRDSLEKDRSNAVQQKELEEYLIELSNLLKDTGIKSRIIAQYLPIMNKCINHYLEILDFFVSFNLDENFNETIRSRHRDDFSYDSFSEGEKQRIDLAILFAWRQIARMKNSVNTNLLILDEIGDSSLDNDGIDNLMKILETVDEDAAVFVISHRGDLFESKFDSKIEFVKEKLFTKIA